MPNPIAGQCFNRWTVINFSHRSKEGVAYYNCRCECGQEKAVHAGHLTHDRSKDCGCSRLKRLAERQRKYMTKHGEADQTQEYKSWLSMRARCKDPTRRYHAARGIVVDPRWNDYSVFLADMGRKPTPKHTIDRIDNDGNYTPSNCRWATKREQVLNRRPH